MRTSVTRASGALVDEVHFSCCCRQPPAIGLAVEDWRNLALALLTARIADKRIVSVSAVASDDQDDVPGLLPRLDVSGRLDHVPERVTARPPSTLKASTWTPRDTRHCDLREAVTDEPMSWRIRGTYFESCNCDPICPCRQIDGVPGGRSTHGVCMGVLSWLIEEGAADGTDLSGLPVALALRYSDDEPGSPWTWTLYLDARASGEQRAALEGIFSGGFGGDAKRHFPWAWKPSELVAVRPVEIEVDHTRRRQRLRIRDRVSVRIRDRYAGAETVTCVIPGHERAGEELVADELLVEDGPLAFSYRGVCGYGSTFDYAG